MSSISVLSQPVSVGPSPHPRQLPPADGFLHIGSVPYLNVRPLLRALRQVFERAGLWTAMFPAGLKVTEAVPRILAERARRGQFHAAIVPVFEVLSHSYGAFLPGSCIAARGAVESVVLFADDPLESLTRIELDPASLTSVHLIQVLLSLRGQQVEYVEPTAAHGKDDKPARTPPRFPKYRGRLLLPGATHGEPGPLQLPPRTGRLLIGDAALARRGMHATEWDLASAWLSATGLPFVFAAWHAPDPTWAEPHHPLGSLFQQVAMEVDHHRMIAAREDGPRFGFDAALAEAYLTRAIHYDFGSEEQAGLSRFGRECQRLGFLSRSIPGDVEWAGPLTVHQPGPAAQTP